MSHEGHTYSLYVHISYNNPLIIEYYSLQNFHFFQICKNTYERKSYALAFKRFYGVHSYDKIAEILEEIRKEFRIEDKKLVATVTDNGKRPMIKLLLFTSSFH